MLIGNKSDIEEDQWEVTTKEVQEMAEQKGLLWRITSAKQGTAVHEAFYHLTEEISLKKKTVKEDSIELKLEQRGSITQSIQNSCCGA